MLTLCIISTSFGFWSCYQTSNRVKNRVPTNLKRVFWENQRNKIGIFGMVIGLILSLKAFGIGSGIFSFLLILTCVASLVVILTPLRVVSYKVFAGIAILSFIFEVVS